MDARRWRGWLAGIAATLLAEPACVTPSIDGVEEDWAGFPVEWHTVARTDPKRAVDVLLVLDDSASMGEEQVELVASFESFVDVLERPGMRLDYRIGVTTANVGNPQCAATTPEAGALQLRSCRGHLGDFVGVGEGTPPLDATEACTAACPEEWAEIQTLPTTTARDDEPRPRPWIERSAGVTNLPAGLHPAQALQCIAPQGIAGCSFESPLEAMWQAVRRSYDDHDPVSGFIREDAVLLVVLVTDEDDCSYEPTWDAMFRPEGNRVFWADPNASAPTSAACWNAGVECRGEGEDRECWAVDRDVDGNLVDEADADALAVLRPVSRYVELLQAIEDDKQLDRPYRQVLVSILVGVRPDGSADYDGAASDPVFEQGFGVGPGCVSDVGRATPPVRLRELADAFAVNDSQNMFSICSGDHSVVFESLAPREPGTFRPACMPICVADVDASTPDVLDPACEVVQVVPHEDGALQEVAVPECEAGSALPVGHDVCHVPLWGAELGSDCIDRGYNLEFQLLRREGVYVVPETEVRARCRPSELEAVDCPDLP